MLWTLKTIFILGKIFGKNPWVERYCALCISYVNVCDPRDDLKAEALLSCCSCSSGLGYYSPEFHQHNHQTAHQAGHNVILTVWDVCIAQQSCSMVWLTLSTQPFLTMSICIFLIAGSFLNIVLNSWWFSRVWPGPGWRWDLVSVCSVFSSVWPDWCNILSVLWWTWDLGPETSPLTPPR